MVALVPSALAVGAGIGGGSGTGTPGGSAQESPTRVEITPSQRAGECIALPYKYPEKVKDPILLIPSCQLAIDYIPTEVDTPFGIGAGAVSAVANAPNAMLSMAWRGVAYFEDISLGILSLALHGEVGKLLVTPFQGVADVMLNGLGGPQYVAFVIMIPLLLGAWAVRRSITDGSKHFVDAILIVLVLTAGPMLALEQSINTSLKQQAAGVAANVYFVGQGSDAQIKPTDFGSKGDALIGVLREKMLEDSARVTYGGVIVPAVGKEVQSVNTLRAGKQTNHGGYAARVWMLPEGSNCRFAVNTAISKAETISGTDVQDCIDGLRDSGGVRANYSANYVEDHKSLYTSWPIDRVDKGAGTPRGGLGSPELFAYIFGTFISAAIILLFAVMMIAAEIAPLALITCGALAVVGMVVKTDGSFTRSYTKKIWLYTVQGSLWLLVFAFAIGIYVTLDRIDFFRTAAIAPLLLPACFVGMVIFRLKVLGDLDSAIAGRGIGDKILPAAAAAGGAYAGSKLADGGKKLVTNPTMAVASELKSRIKPGAATDAGTDEKSQRRIKTAAGSKLGGAAGAAHAAKVGASLAGQSVSRGVASKLGEMPDTNAATRLASNATDAANATHGSADTMLRRALAHDDAVVDPVTQGLASVPLADLSPSMERGFRALHTDNPTAASDALRKVESAPAAQRARVAREELAKAQIDPAKVASQPARISTPIGVEQKATDARRHATRLENQHAAATGDDRARLSDQLQQSKRQADIMDAAAGHTHQDPDAAIHARVKKAMRPDEYADKGGAVERMLQAGATPEEAGSALRLSDHSLRRL